MMGKFLSQNLIRDIRKQDMLDIQTEYLTDTRNEHCFSIFRLRRLQPAHLLARGRHHLPLVHRLGNTVQVVVPPMRMAASHRLIARNNFKLYHI